MSLNQTHMTSCEAIARVSPAVAGDDKPSARESEDRIIERVLLGDTGAFGLLVCEYQNRLFNTVLRVTRCPAESEDVVQEALLQSFVQLHTFRRDSRFYTWLYRIALNIACSRIRRKRREISLEQNRSLVPAEPIDARDTSHDGFESQENKRRLREAMSALDKKSRMILVLREFKSCNYRTISRILNVPVGTVKSRLHRARMQLRDRFYEIRRQES